MEYRASGTAVFVLVCSGHMFRLFWEAIIARLKNTDKINTILIQAVRMVLLQISEIRMVLLQISEITTYKK
jgi:S-adenosylmethionine/arginine decarboxylase-like enzyme